MPLRQQTKLICKKSKEKKMIVLKKMLLISLAIALTKRDIMSQTILIQKTHYSYDYCYIDTC